MKIIIIALFSVLTLNAWAQKETVEIKTSAQCEMCKERIVEEMQFTKGVLAVDVDVESQIVLITYKIKKTSPAKIREAISKIGYAADTVKADTKAYNKLPECCQEPGLIPLRKEE